MKKIKSVEIGSTTGNANTYFGTTITTDGTNLVYYGDLAEVHIPPGAFTISNDYPITNYYPQEKENPKMRGLFDVYIVDPEIDDVAWSKCIIAKDEQSAKLKVVSSATLTKDIDDYDIIVVKLGNVRPKKEVQEVKVVKE